MLMTVLPFMLRQTQTKPVLAPLTFPALGFEGAKPRRERKPKERIAVVAGSFDPPTNGHLWVIQQARKLFDKVIVVMAVNPEKRPTFSDAERKTMFDALLKNMPGVSFQTISRQFLVDFAKSVKATALIRGVRNATDLEYEQTLCDANRKVAPEIQTLILMPPKHLQQLSSSFVRGMVGYVNWRDWVAPLVPPVVMTQMKTLYLTQRWEKLAGRLGLDSAQAKEGLKQVISAYSEKSRYYHNLDHVIDCLEQLDRYRDGGENPAPVMADVLELSLWFHDVVDERGNPQGVDQSADAAVAFYQKAAKSPSEAEVKQLRANIMATKHFAPKTEALNLDSQLMVDMDLSILGQAKKKYTQYQEQIRREYGPLYGASYAPGRAQVMQQFLDRPFIYHTDWFRKQYETKARRNVSAEVTSLKA